MDVANRKYDLERLKRVSTEEAQSQIMGMHGVGVKVANCMLLFGLEHTDAFPIDVWIQRVIDDYYGGEIEVTKFKDIAGIIQQYMFYYIRKIYGR